jgi:hypothetical protein
MKNDEYFSIEHDAFKQFERDGFHRIAEEYDGNCEGDISSK